MQVLSLRSINPTRLDLLLRTFLTAPDVQNTILTRIALKNQTTERIQDKTILEDLFHNVNFLSLKSIAKIEPIITPIIPNLENMIQKFKKFFRFDYLKVRQSNLILSKYLTFPSFRRPKSVALWTKVSHLSKYNSSDIMTTIKLYEHEKYIIVLNTNNFDRDIIVETFFQKGFQPIDQLKASLEVYLLVYIYNIIGSCHTQQYDCRILARELTNLLFPVLQKILLHQQWDLNRISLVPIDHPTIFEIYKSKEEKQVINNKRCNEAVVHLL